MTPTQDEIDVVLNQAMEQVDAGTTNFPGMSYEQGVDNGIRWALGWSDDDPMEE